MLRRLPSRKGRRRDGCCGRVFVSILAEDERGYKCKRCVPWGRKYERHISDKDSDSYIKMILSRGDRCSVCMRKKIEESILSLTRIMNLPREEPSLCRVYGKTLINVFSWTLFILTFWLHGWCQCNRHVLDRMNIWRWKAQSVRWSLKRGRGTQTQ